MGLPRRTVSDELFPAFDEFLGALCHLLPHQLGAGQGSGRSLRALPSGQNRRGSASRSGLKLTLLQGFRLDLGVTFRGGRSYRRRAAAE